MRVTLNLATRPFADLGPAIRQLRIAMGALVLVCLALGGGLYALHRKADSARAREHSLDGALAKVTTERQGYQRTMQLPANAQLLAQSEALNQLFDEKAFSWTLAMESLETVLPAGVQVTTLEPVRDKTGVITLHLRVAGPRDKSEELVKNLEHSVRFLKPRIVGENAEANENAGANQKLEPVSASNRFDFDLLAEYNPPAPGERRIVAPKAATNRAAETAPASRTIAPIVPNGRTPYTAPIITAPAPAPAMPMQRTMPMPTPQQPTPMQQQLAPDPAQQRRFSMPPPMPPSNQGGPQ